MIAELGYGFAAAAFLVGTLIAVQAYRSMSGARAQSAFAYLAIIPGFAGLSYVAMAFGVGTVTAGGTEFVGFRYADWLVTTPLLIGFVGYVAGASRRAIAGVMIADACMIVAGAGAVLTTGTVKWVAFAVSALFHAGLFVYLYRIFPRSVPDKPKRVGLFNLLKNHIGLLWLAYPFVWLAGPAGLGYATLAGASLTYAFLDVMAKVPYVYFFYVRRSAFTDRIEGEPEREKPVSVAD
jgi:sensory rhodopsin